MPPRDPDQQPGDGLAIGAYGLAVMGVGFLLLWLLRWESERYVLGWMHYLGWVGAAIGLAGMGVFLYGFLQHLQIAWDRLGSRRERRERGADLPDTSSHEREPPPGSN